MQRVVFAVVLALIHNAAVGQGVERLPSALSGRWTSMGGSQTFIDSLSMAFDGNGEPGPIKGRLTFRGVNCGALDEPLSGTWDGTVLRFQTMHKPGINTQRLGGSCGDGIVTYELKRSPGNKAFEGTGALGSARITVNVTP